MAHLLGSQDCLESLARDIADIQTTIKDGTERIRPLRVQSWKFPDKLSNELDIDDLLSTYSFSKEGDFNRLSHIVLFELVIDRFLFLTQVASQYLDEICSIIDNPSSSKRPKSRTTGTAMSIGLIVKKFWSKTVNVHHKMQLSKHKINEKSNVVPEMQHTIANMQEDNEMMREAILAMRGSNSIAEERSASAMSNRSNVSLMLSSTKSVSLVGQNEGNMTQEITLSTEDLAVSKIKVNTATQTFDTAFVSCEACASMQQNLIDVGSAVISLCESQGLPSSLANQKKLLKKSIMAANDVSRWAMDQNRDIERINKHLDKLYQQIDPLRTDLEKSRMHCSMLKEQMKVLENEKDDIETELSGKELEWKEKVETLSIKFFKEEKKLKAEILQLKVGKEAIEKSLAKLKDDHVNQRKLNEKLEEENTTLSKNLKEEVKNKLKLKDVEKDFYGIKENLINVRDKLTATEIELGKTQTENKALSKHDKALQAKQELLLQRADQLDQECEELQNRLTEMEEDKEELENECEAMKNENELVAKKSVDLQMLVDQTANAKETLENEVRELNKKVSELENEIEITKKKLTLLSEFPVLGHLGKEDPAILKNKTDMSLNEEMAQQIKANNIRIAVLEEQNTSLRETLSKYEEYHDKVPSGIPKDRVPLWSNGEISRFEEEKLCRTSRETTRYSSKELHDSMSKEQHDSTGSLEWIATDSKPKRDYSQNPKPPSQPRTANSKLNEKRQAYVMGKSRDYEKSQSQLSDVSPVAKGISSKSDGQNGYQPTEVFSCPDCDKMYSNKRDLKIHKSFCFAKV
eukprot:Seg2723.4 transcript_id=Seg2723.4/GoldUCD/mRNA.D3Y31 product="Coiled-coil domain-containing protein 157" protein_id=Seg2723.4/GoldUCD/D3Y31